MLVGIVYLYRQEKNLTPKLPFKRVKETLRVSYTGAELSSIQVEVAMRASGLMIKSMAKVS